LKPLVFKKNGFLELEPNTFSNNICNVIINENDGYYEIIINNVGAVYSNDLNIYWLIGLLIYNGYMKKNYII